MAFYAGDRVRCVSPAGPSGRGFDDLLPRDGIYTVECVHGNEYFILPPKNAQGKICSHGAGWTLKDEDLQLAMWSKPEPKLKIAPDWKGGWTTWSYPDGKIMTYDESTIEEIRLFKDEVTIKPMSSILEKFKTSLLKEPQKSFRKAGITNGDNMLTTEGTAIFLSYLLEKEGDAFKSAVVDELLEEEKKKE